MGLTIWIVMGTMAGSCARFVMPGPDRLGTIGSAGLGALGAVAGGVVGTSIGATSFASFDVRSLLTAIIGCIATLFLYRSYSLRE